MSSPPLTPTEALRLIAGDPPDCTRLTSGPGACWTVYALRAQYDDDRWCDACIALAALDPQRYDRALAAEARRKEIHRATLWLHLLSRHDTTVVGDLARATDEHNRLHAESRTGYDPGYHAEHETGFDLEAVAQRLAPEQTGATQ